MSLEIKMISVELMRVGLKPLILVILVILSYFIVWLGRSSATPMPSNQNNPKTKRDGTESPPEITTRKTDAEPESDRGIETNDTGVEFSDEMPELELVDNLSELD